MDHTSTAAPTRRLIPRAITGAAAALAITLIAACGSSTPAGGVSGADHGSADGAVRGFVNALVGWDGSVNGLNSVSDWVAPSQRGQFTSSFSSLFGGSSNGVKISFKVDNFDISGDKQTDSTHVTVTVKGNASFCFSGSFSGVALNTCSSNALTPNGTNNSIPTVQVGGQWYVDINASGGSSSSSSSSSTDTTTTTTTTTSTDTTTTSTDTGSTGVASTTSST